MKLPRNPRAREGSLAEEKDQTVSACSRRPRHSLRWLLALKAFGDPALDLLETLRRVSLKRGFAIGIFFASHTVVSQRQLKMAGGAVWGELFVRFKRRNGVGELLGGNQRGAETKIRLGEASVNFCSSGVMADRRGKITVVFRELGENVFCAGIIRIDR